MKKSRLICWILCFALVLQCAVGGIMATDVAEEPVESTAQTTQTPEEPQQTEPSDTTPTEPPYAVPAKYLEDPSIANGVHTIHARYALTTGHDFELGVKAAMLYELNTGTMLYGNNLDQQMYPASLTKIMTCLLALEYGNLTDEITVTESAVSGIDPDGSTANLWVGETMTLENLLYCLMVSSANDAACVIGEYISGSVSDFVKLMNEKAQELDCTGTHFMNPHGLHDPMHYTTARDIGKIMLAALEYPAFETLYSTPSYDVPATNLCESRHLESTNYFISTGRTAGYYDERVIGGKTGFTTPAGRCLACTAQDGDLKLLSVVLGGDSTYQGDGVTILAYGSFVQTEKLLNYGFDNFKLVDAISQSQTVGQFQVSGGANSTVGHPAETLQVALPVEFEQGALRWDYVQTNNNLTAPLQAETELGTVCSWYENFCLTQTALLAANGVEPMEQAISEMQQGDMEPTDQTNGRSWREYVILGAFVFGGIVVLFVVLVLGLVIRNAMIRAKHRRRRRERRRSR